MQDRAPNEKKKNQGSATFKTLALKVISDAGPQVRAELEKAAECHNEDIHSHL